MSKIHSLEINNYRGIKHFSQVFNSESLVVLIGRGDSGKSTILKAISCVLSPNWNLQFSDWDFHNCDTSSAITITAQISEFPDELLTYQKHGLHIGFLKEDDTVYYPIDEDVQPSEKDKPILTIRLTVDSTLEPKWKVLYGDSFSQEADITSSDRAKLKFYAITDYIDNQFTYSKGSPLYSLSNMVMEEKPETSKELVSLMREIYTNINHETLFDDFSDVNKTIIDKANSIGLDLSELKTKIEFKPNAYTESSISLHRGNIPYKFYGKGSKRLLSIAIQLALIKNGGIVTIDEIEQGLEPDRVRCIVRHFRNNKSGQVFLTTHSKDVVTEAAYNNLFLTRANVAKLQTFDDDLQRLLRAQPDAFFSKRIILCEGATECGIIRALESHLFQKESISLSAKGIVYLDANGEANMFQRSVQLKSMGFDVLAFGDNDRTEDVKAKNNAIESNVTIVICEENNALEKQLFKDLSWAAVCDMIEYAIELYKGDTSFLPFAFCDLKDLRACEDENEKEKIRDACGKQSAKSGWYKRIYAGIIIGGIIIQDLDAMSENCILRQEFDIIIKWIKK